MLTVEVTMVTDGRTLAPGYVRLDHAPKGLRTAIGQVLRTARRSSRDAFLVVVTDTATGDWLAARGTRRGLVGHVGKLDQVGECLPDWIRAVARGQLDGEGKPLSDRRRGWSIEFEGGRET